MSATIPVPVGNVDAPIKPLVFISASSQDHALRDRLKLKLDEYGDYFEWWDDSKIPTGKLWQKEIDAAIRRASVALVLLSPVYLSSTTATSELIHLGQQAESGNGLKLFPIVLEESHWQPFTALRQVQIWAKAKPIGHLSGEELELRRW